MKIKKMNKKFLMIIGVPFLLVSKINEKIWGFADPNTYSKYKYFVKFLNINKDFSGSICDIGCGGGYLACFLAKKFPHSQIIGVDLSEEKINDAIKMATSQNIKNISFKKLDAMNTNFETEKFDRVISTQVLEHFTFKDGKIFLNEINRILKRGGYFVLNVPGSMFMTYPFFILRLFSKIKLIREKSKNLELFWLAGHYPAYEIHEHLKAGFAPEEMYCLTGDTNLSMQRYHYTYKTLTAMLFELQTIKKPLGNLLSPIVYILYFIESLIFKKGLDLTCQFYKTENQKQ